MSYNRGRTCDSNRNRTRHRSKGSSDDLHTTSRYLSSISSSHKTQSDSAGSGMDGCDSPPRLVGRVTAPMSLTSMKRLRQCSGRTEGLRSKKVSTQAPSRSRSVPTSGRSTRRVLAEGLVIQSLLDPSYIGDENG